MIRYNYLPHRLNKLMYEFIGWLHSLLNFIFVSFPAVVDPTFSSCYYDNFWLLNS